MIMKDYITAKDRINLLRGKKWKVIVWVTACLPKKHGLFEQ